MNIRHIEYSADKAEGTCHGLPYNTELASSEGVSVHFWVEAPEDQTRLKEALKKLRGARDVVYATWSLGKPIGYWAHSDIE